MGYIRRSTGLGLDGSSTSAAPVSDPGTIRLRSNAAGTAIEVSYNGAAYTTFSGGGGPAGTGTELQYRNGAAFGAVAGSSNVSGDITLAASGASRVFSLQTWGTSVLPQFRFIQARGVLGTPTRTQTDDILGAVDFFGNGDASDSLTSFERGARISAVAVENWDDATQDWGTDLVFSTKRDSLSIRVAGRFTADQRLGIGDQITHADVTARLRVITGTNDLVGLRLDAPTGGTADILQVYNQASVKAIYVDSNSTLHTVDSNDVAGLNLGSVAGDPVSVLNNGDVWYNSSTHTFRGRANGASISLGGGVTGAGVTNALTYWSSSSAVDDVAGSTVAGANVTLAGDFAVNQENNSLSQIGAWGGGFIPTLRVHHARGTIASPSLVFVGESLGRVDFTGNYNTSTTITNANVGARIEALVEQANWGALNRWADLCFYTRTSLTGEPDLNMRLTGEGRLGIGPAIVGASVTHLLTVLGTGKFTGQVQFTPTGTLAGLNVGSLAGDPSGLNNGDIWYSTATNALRARINGATVSLGAGGGTIDGSGSANALTYWTDSDTVDDVTGSSVSGGNLTLTGNITLNQDSVVNALSSRHFFASSAGGAIFLAKGRGTAASPTAVLANDELGTLAFAGQYSSTIGQITTGGGIYAEAVSNFTATNAAETDITIRCKPAGSSAVHIGLRVTSDSRVGIGDEITHAQTTARLTVIGGALYTMTTSESFVVTSDVLFTSLEGHAYGTTNNPNYFLYRGRGTKASPTAVQSGDIIGQFSFAGQYNSSVGGGQVCAGMRADAIANFTASNDQPTDLVFLTKRNTIGVRVGIRLTADRYVGIGDQIANSDIGARLHVLETDTAVVGAIIRTAASSTADCLRLMASSTTKVKFTTNASGDMNSVFGSAALSTSATDGFIFLPTCAGTPSGTPSTFTGMLPIVIDSTAKKIWINFTGTGWLSVALA